MLSSISSFDRPTRRDVIRLLLACVLVCLAVEAGAALLFRRISHIEGRRESEYRAALAIRRGQDHHRLSVLLAGNSLLLEGVDFPRLQKEAGPDLELRRIVVENTSYLDWYYGLRRVFKLGAQPDVVVLVLSPIQLISRSTDGDYTAHLLLDSRDMVELARDTGADRNRLSSIALSNASFFYGTRAEIRTWILGRILPRLSSLTQFFHAKPPLPSPSAIREVAASRLAQMNRLCRKHEVRLIVVVPPTPENRGTSEVLQAAADTGVVAVLPVSPGILAESDYSDGFHLNSRGAGVFTPALARDLRQNLLLTAVLEQEGASAPELLTVPRNRSLGLPPSPRIASERSGF
jgi:hypothetical protein